MLLINVILLSISGIKALYMLNNVCVIVVFFSQTYGENKLICNEMMMRSALY